MAGINMPTAPARGPSVLDQIVKATEVANNIIGGVSKGASAYETIDKLRQPEGVISPAQALQFGATKVASGTTGSISALMINPATGQNEPTYLMAKQPETLADKIALINNKAEQERITNKEKPASGFGAFAGQRLDLAQRKAVEAAVSKAETDPIQNKLSDTLIGVNNATNLINSGGVITPQVLSELEQRVTNTISGGQAASMGKLQRTEMESGGRKLAELKQYITGDPQAAGSPQYINQLKDVLGRLQQSTSQAAADRYDMLIAPAAKNYEKFAGATEVFATAKESFLKRAGAVIDQAQPQAVTNQVESAGAKETKYPSSIETGISNVMKTNNIDRAAAISALKAAGKLK